MPGPPNSELTDEKIKLLLQPFLVVPYSAQISQTQISQTQISQIREYLKLLLKWNRSLNLTSLKDHAEIISRHFGESMFLCSLLPVENGRLADVGTGAGFPGLALKILSPELRVHLIESNKKKCAFLAEVVRTLGLNEVQIEPNRFEETRLEPNSIDFVTARALGEFSALLKWARTSMYASGHLVLWLGGEDATRISKTHGWIWQTPVRIPDSQRRFLLVGRPAHPD